MTKRERRQAIEGYLSIMPWIIGFLLFTGGPIIASLVLSLTKWNMMSPSHFVGLANYKTLLQDETFWQSLKVTGKFTVVVIPLGILLGFSIALLLNQRLRGLSVWRTLYFLPSLITGVALALVWQVILNPEIGFINQLLALMGFTGPQWLFDPRWALFGMIIMTLWQSGGAMVIYLAGLQGIPTQLYEAAELDGAGIWHKFLHITIPMMTPILLFQLIMGIINTLQFFAPAFVMTGGGPEKSTLFYSLQLYFTAFQDFEMGRACAMAWILFVIILFLTLLVFKTSSRWVYYEGK